MAPSSWAERSFSSRVRPVPSTLVFVPQRPLGIRAGEKWAYRGGSSQPLLPALVLKAGAHYEALIRIRLLDDPEQTAMWVRRAKMPCLWDDRHEWLEAHPQHRVSEDPEFLPEPAPDEVTVSVDALRRVIRDEIHAAMSPPPVSYSLTDAARATGVSVETIRRAVRSNLLVPNYVGRKPLFRVDELQRWVSSLPDETPR